MIPLVLKASVSIVCISSGWEAYALRDVLEGFNFRVDVLWIGSRAEFVEVLKGTIETHKYFILACHGIEEGVFMPDEPAVSPAEIGTLINLPGKVVLNLGCGTGNDAYVEAFLKKGRVRSYIGPVDYPDAKSALLFGIHFFYELAEKKSIEEAYHKAANFDEAAKMFRFFRSNS